MLREFCKHFAPFCWLLDFPQACGSCSTTALLKTIPTCPLPNLRVGSSPVGRVNMYARWQVLCRVQTALQQQTSNAAYSIVQRVSWYTTRLCRGYAQFTTLLLFDAGEVQKGESRLH